jgi:dCMP deaminase
VTLTLTDVPEPPPRATWDQTWLAIATVVAQRSWCARRQVGAVIVTRDNRVASVSYNGPPRGQRVVTTCDHWCRRAINEDLTINQNPTLYDNCDAIHAEANALLRADYTDIAGGTVYVSSAMCVNCAKLIANSGVSRVVHVVDEERDAHRRPDDVELQLRQWGLAVQRARNLCDG